jgi:hypothetical protein
MNRDDVRAREAFVTISRLFREFMVGNLTSFANINQTKDAKLLEIFSTVFNLSITGKNLFKGIIRNRAVNLNKLDPGKLIKT